MRKLPSPKWSRTRLEPEIGIFGERGHGHTRSLAAEEGRQVITPPSPTIKFKDDLEKVEIELPPPVKSESRATYDSERRKKQISNVYLKTGSHSKGGMQIYIYIYIYNVHREIRELSRRGKI